MTTFLSTTIEHWPVEKLIPYDRNARTHSEEQIEQIVRSIREFGFTNPILVDTGAGILAGHARLLAARRVGLSQVPVIVLDRRDGHNSRRPSNDGQAQIPRQAVVRPMGTHVSPCPMRVPTVRPR